MKTSLMLSSPNIEDNILEHVPYFGIWDLDDDDLENNSHLMDINASHENENDNYNSSDNEYSAFDPNLLDFDTGFEDGDIPSLLEHSGLPLDTYYEMCPQLNEGQQDPFNFIMKWAMKYMLHK